MEAMPTNMEVLATKDKRKLVITKGGEYMVTDFVNGEVVVTLFDDIQSAADYFNEGK